MKGGYIIVQLRHRGRRHGDQRARRVRRGRRRRPRLPPGHHLGRHRLHGGARRGQVPRAAGRRRALSGRPAAPCALQAEIVERIADVPAAEWNALDRGRQPVPAARVPRGARGTRAASAATAAGCRAPRCCATTTAGWSARCPQYLKAHSWGEFVFDWSWAQAYARAGLDYYPKLLSAVPFTPVTGPAPAGRGRRATPQIARAHWPRLLLEAARAVRRLGRARQFHDRRRPGGARAARASCGGTTAGSTGTTAATATSMTSSTRFRVGQAQEGAARAAPRRRSRHRVPHAAGEPTSTRALWRTIFGFSERTFLRHGNEHYLSAGVPRARSRRRMPEHRRGEARASAAACRSRPRSSSRAADALYGRYWGAAGARRLPALRGLLLPGHRATASRTGSRRFDPGTQGEHKLARGFEPTLTHSAHWLAHRGLRDAPSVATSSASGPASTSTSRRPRTTCPSSAGRRRMIPWLRAGRPAGRVSRRSMTALTEPDGLLCAGGDLSPARLLEAYRRGIFPWYSEGQPILWWSPDPRAVLFPDEFQVSRSLAKTLRNRGFETTLDRAFGDVIAPVRRRRASARRAPGSRRRCRPPTSGCTRLGFAHSVEIWRDGRAGRRPVRRALGRVFFGESMFSRSATPRRWRSRDWWTVSLARGVELIDCQIASAAPREPRRARPPAARVRRATCRGRSRT